MAVGKTEVITVCVCACACVCPCARAGALEYSVYGEGLLKS